MSSLFSKVSLNLNRTLVLPCYISCSNDDSYGMFRYLCCYHFTILSQWPNLGAQPYPLAPYGGPIENPQDNIYTMGRRSIQSMSVGYPSRPERVNSSTKGRSNRKTKDQTPGAAGPSHCLCVFVVFIVSKDT